MANLNKAFAATDEDVLQEIRGILAQIQFGSLEISIHNGRIVQLEKREKKRFDKGENAK